MAPFFNLLDEPWIPCIDLEGIPHELSLRQVFARAHELREIRDNSPVITASLHRLLLAILHRNFGPSDLKAWVGLWERKSFDAHVLDDYFAQWHERFYLFHPDRPFYQCVDEETREAREAPVAKLAHELAAGNNDTLFDHSLEADPPPFTAAQAARLVVTAQSYAVGGGNSKPFNLCHAPLLSGALVLLSGENLHQTLLLNLVRYDEDSPMHNEPDDVPAWELEVPHPPGRRQPEGYLDYLTFQSRRLLLRREEEQVRFVHILQGYALSDGVDDPMMALLQRNEKYGFLPLRIQPERALWRDSHALYADAPGLTKCPETVRHLARVRGHYPDLPLPPIRIQVFGLATDKAKVNLWRHEVYPLPHAYISANDGIGAALRWALDAADKSGRALRWSIEILAQNLLSPLESSERSPDKDAVRALRDALNPAAHFWSGLEVPFQRVVVDLSESPEQTLNDWSETLKKRAISSLQSVTMSLDGSGRALKATVEAEGALRNTLRKQLQNQEGGE